MESDKPKRHSESKFYYPDEKDENVNTENILVGNFRFANKFQT